MWSMAATAILQLLLLRRQLKSVSMAVQSHNCVWWATLHIFQGLICYFTHCKHSKICKIHFTITICFRCLLPHKFAQFAFCLQWHLSGRQLHLLQFYCSNNEAHIYQLNFATKTNLHTIKAKLCKRQNRRQKIIRWRRKAAAVDMLIAV